MLYKKNGKEIIISQYLIADKTKHYSFIVGTGEYSMMMGNNDGAVEIASEIFSAAQSDAKGFYGFNETHTSILTSDEVIVLLLELINNKKH